MSHRKSGVRFAALACSIVGLGAGAFGAWAEGLSTDSSPSLEEPSQLLTRTANPFAERFPNVVLKTHDGRNVRFYEDLLKDKIVLINFMYASCTER